MYELEKSVNNNNKVDIENIENIKNIIFRLKISWYHIMIMIYRPIIDIFVPTLVVNIWNSLPESVFLADSIDWFNKLDKFWSNQDMLFDIIFH